MARWKELVARKIKETRKEKNLTQVQMSEQIGCSQGYISRLERQLVLYPPSNGFWAEFAELYGGSLDELMLLSGRVSEKRAMELLGEK